MKSGELNINHWGITWMTVGSLNPPNRVFGEPGECIGRRKGEDPLQGLRSELIPRCKI